MTGTAAETLRELERKGPIAPIHFVVMVVGLSLDLFASALAPVLGSPDFIKIEGQFLMYSVLFLSYRQSQRIKEARQLEKKERLQNQADLAYAGFKSKTANTPEPSTHLTVDRLDHLVLTVKNIDATCAFYKQVLGMEEVTFGNGRKSLTFGSQKINLHEQGHEFEPKANHPTPGSADLCFICTEPMEKIVEHLQGCRVPVLEGPVSRNGALGAMTSVYFRDPDLNLIELSHYPASAS